MKRKIHYVVTIADRFIQNTDWAFPFDVPDPFGQRIEFSDLIIEYEQIDKDPLVDASDALRRWVKENYPTMDYRTYYWTLEFI